MRLLLAVALTLLLALPVAAQDAGAGDDQAFELADDEPATEPAAEPADDEPATEPTAGTTAEAWAPATVAVELPSGQTAEIVLTATLGEMALLAVAFFFVAWRVAVWSWWLLTELLS